MILILAEQGISSAPLPEVCEIPVSRSAVFALVMSEKVVEL
jgi:hypothetical protein